MRDVAARPSFRLGETGPTYAVVKERPAQGPTCTSYPEPNGDEGNPKKAPSVRCPRTASGLR